MNVRLKGFSPVLDSMIEEVGPMAALVYARIYRFCQLERKQCDASLETIADSLNVSRKTVERHLKVLVGRGYVLDLTPDLRHKPHNYTVTGKAELEMEVSIGQTKSPTRSDNLSYQVGQIVGPRSDKLSYKDTEQDTEQDTSMGAGAPETPEAPEPVKEEKPIPVNLGQWLTGLKDDKNPVAYLVFAYQTLYPDAPEVPFGKMGALKKRVGGEEQMLRYMYEFSGKGVDDPVTYIVAAHRNRTGGKKPGSSDGRSGSSGKEPHESHESTVEEQYRKSMERAGLG